MTEEAQPHWYLTLYVSGASPNSAAALDAVQRLCDGELAGKVDLQIVDVRDQPALVVRDDIFAVPTLVKRLPEPLRSLVGDLGDMARVRVGLDLPAEPEDETREQTP